MKYGLRKTNPTTEVDEEWKNIMENNITYLKIEIGCLKQQLQESKHKIELLTPKNPGFQNFGFPCAAQYQAVSQAPNTWPAKPSVDFRPSYLNKTDQNQCNAFSSPLSGWPTKPTIGCRPSWWQYPTCGTQSTPYQITCSNEYSNNSKAITVRYMCITTMEQYDNKSLEELRYEDYIARDGLQSQQKNPFYDQSVTASTDSDAFVNRRSCFGPPVIRSTGFNIFANPRSCFGPPAIGSTDSNAFANPRTCFGPPVIGSTGFNTFANSRSCFGPPAIGSTGFNTFANPRSCFGPPVIGSTGFNTFANPRSCFGPPISPTTGLKCFSNQSQNSDGAGINSKQNMLHDFPNGSIEKPNIVHKPDCFESLIQKEVISQMVSKLNKMDKYFRTITTRLTSMESHLDDVSSNMSVMVSHMSAIDMHLAMQRVDRKWKGLGTCLANLEASPQDQIKGGTLHLPAPIDPLKGEVKTSTALKSDQSPIEDMSVMSSTLNASEVGATEKEEMSPSENSSNTESKLSFQMFSNCTNEFSDLCYVRPLTWKPGSLKNNQSGPLLFGCTPTKTSDSKMDISSNGSSPLSVDKPKDVKQKQKGIDSKSTLVAADENGTKDSTEFSSDRSPIVEDMSVLSSSLNASEVGATEKDEMLLSENSLNNKSKLDLKMFSKCTNEFADLRHVKPTPPFFFKTTLSKNNRGCPLFFECTPTKTSDSKMDISSNGSSPLSVDKSEKTKDVKQKQKGIDPKSTLVAADENGTKDSTQFSVAGEQGSSISCIDEHNSSRESRVVILEQKENLNTSKPSVSVTSGVSRNLLETKSNNGHELFVTVSTQHFSNPEAPKNISFENVTSTSGLGTYNSIDVGNQIPLETLPENKCTDKQEITSECQPENVRTSIGTENLLFSTTEMGNRLRDLTTQNANGETIVDSTNTDNEQRLNVLIDPTENVKMSGGTDNLFLDPPNVTIDFKTCNQHNIVSDSSIDSKETKTEKVTAVADEAISLNNEENKSDEENDFVIVEKSDVALSNQHSYGNEQCSVLSEASTNESTSFKACNDITEYLEINLGKKKDVVYEFGFEVKLDSPASESTLETSVRDWNAEGEISKVYGDNREKDDSFNAFTSHFIANCSEKQSSPVPKDSKANGGSLKKKQAKPDPSINRFVPIIRRKPSTPLLAATNKPDKSKMINPFEQPS